MADYITKIRTADGDLPYDYNSLANLPSDLKLLYETTTTEEVVNIYSGVNPSEYKEIFMYCVSMSADSSKTAHFDWHFMTDTGAGIRNMSALHNAQVRCFCFHGIKLNDKIWEVDIVYGSCAIGLGTEVGKRTVEMNNDRKKCLVLNDTLVSDMGCGAYVYSEVNLAIGTIFKVYGK